MRSEMHGQRTGRQGWGGYCGEQFWRHDEKGICWRTVCKGLPPQAGIACRRAIVVMPLACTKLVVERCLHARSMDCAAAHRWLVARRELANVPVRRVEILLCIHTRMAHGLAISTSPPAIYHRTRSPERPQNGSNDRTVSATGACFGDLTPRTRGFNSVC